MPTRMPTPYYKLTEFRARFKGGQTPVEYMKENGTKDYEKFFFCKKRHHYIDTCIRHDFTCTHPTIKLEE